MRQAWLYTTLGTLICGLSLNGCGDDEKKSKGGPEGDAGTGGSVSTGGKSSTGGSPSTGGSGTGGAGTGGAGTGGAGTGGAGTGGSPEGGTMEGGTDGGTDGGYTPPTPTLPTPVGYVAGGQISGLGSVTGISGHGQIIRRADGTTTVQLHVEGLSPDTSYPAHVHAYPCAVESAGGHYKIDPSITTTDQANELWVPFTTDSSGVGRSNVDFTHAARPDAQSIVIHEHPTDAGPPAKMACVDLVPEPTGTTTSSGTFAPFAGATADEKDVAGTATLVRTASGTDVTLAPTGLDPSGTYVAHVHVLPCALTAAGGHYKNDTTVATADEANEIWPIFGDSGTASVSKSFVARPDAQSVVIHRTDLGITPAPKVACADLVREEAYANYKTEGTVTALPDATTYNVAGVAGSGSLTRSLTTTDATVSLTGLLASTAYAVHVHD